MSFKDQIAFVRQHIRRNRLRVFMTVLAATMGTAFLIVLASVGFGLQKTIKDDILSNQMVTQIEVYSEDMSDAKADAMKEIDHVEAVVHRKQLVPAALGELEGYKGYLNTYFTDFKDEEASGFRLAEGRFPEKPDEVIVGSQFAAQLIDKSVEVEEGEDPAYYEGKLIGQTFMFSFEGENEENASGTWPLTIVGVKEAPGKDWAFDGYLYLDESLMEVIESAYVAASPELDKQEDMPFTSSSVNVYADDLANVKAITQKLKDDGYAVYSVSEEIEQIDVFFLALKAGLIFVGTIAILIASIGIFNTMTMAVTERTREIGVMKALGAGPKLIQRLFLMESAWIGLVGTAIAVVISYGVSFAANAILPIIVDAALGGETGDSFEVTFSVIPWQLVLIASAISLSVAMISGWRPARKATKTDVIGALRHEL